MRRCENVKALVFDRIKKLSDISELAFVPNVERIEMYQLKLVDLLSIEDILKNPSLKKCTTGTYCSYQKKGDDYMAGATTNISIRMDSDLKAQADRLFGELGMNLTTAFNIFVRRSLREGRIPFDISLNQPNSETVAAMLEAERIAKDTSVKGCTNLDELFADLKA